ncbi:hypothetical protein Ancab_006532, partial [Ancistrocladus abbreviatus]
SQQQDHSFKLHDLYEAVFQFLIVGRGLWRCKLLFFFSLSGSIGIDRKHFNGK